MFRLPGGPRMRRGHGGRPDRHFRSGRGRGRLRAAGTARAGSPTIAGAGPGEGRRARMESRGRSAGRVPEGDGDMFLKRANRSAAAAGAEPGGGARARSLRQVRASGRHASAAAPRGVSVAGRRGPGGTGGPGRCPGGRSAVRLQATTLKSTTLKPTPCVAPAPAGDRLRRPPVALDNCNYRAQTGQFECGDRAGTNHGREAPAAAMAGISGDFRRFCNPPQPCGRDPGGPAATSDCAR